MDVLAAALDERDGFIRFKVVSALERLRREHPELTLASERIETLVVQEARRYFNFLSLHDNLFGKEKLSPDSLLSQALIEQMARLRNRIFKLLTLLYPPADIDAARWTLEHGDGRDGRARRNTSTTSSRPRFAGRSCPSSKTCGARNACVAAT